MTADNRRWGDCYALAGRYLFPTVRDALERRFEGIYDPLWTPAMALLLRRKRIEWFRWMDSGDLQSVNHLRNIFTVARATPETNHWLSTRERAVKLAAERLEEKPGNLTIRESGTLIDGPPPKATTTSTVHLRLAPPEGSHVCPARKWGNSCNSPEGQECRACWDETRRNIAYVLHPR